MTPLCFIDTETTGVHPDRQVWEVAMIRRQDGREQEVTFFVDVDLALADPFGLKVGRLRRLALGYDDAYMIEARDEQLVAIIKVDVS